MISLSQVDHSAISRLAGDTLPSVEMYAIRDMNKVYSQVIDDGCFT